MGTVEEDAYPHSSQMSGYVLIQYDGDGDRCNTLIDHLRLATKGRPDLGEMKYEVLQDLRKERGAEDPTDWAGDDAIFFSDLDKNLQKYLEWNGIIGFTGEIMSIVRAYHPDV